MIRSPGRSRALVLIIVVAVVAAVAALVFYHMLPQQAAKRKAKREASLKQARFIAEFDSLSKARLYPAIWRAGAFTATEFGPERTTWTLTIRATDWQRRTEESKRDLVARLHASFSGAIAQAGGDPEEAVLIIKDDHDEQVARCMPSHGTEIYK